MVVRPTRSPRCALRRTVLSAVLFTLFLLPATLPAAQTLSQLRGVDELKSWFNTYTGRPRLVFLLSPT
jgi:hypothetical protein